MSVLAVYAQVVAVTRTVLLYLAILVAAICAFDWAVRTRRISPFNQIARFFRGRIEPLMAPVERVVVRRGGLPANAPLWALGAVVVGGIALIFLLQLIGGVVQQALFGLHDPSRIPMILVSWAFSILRLALLVRVVVSWLPISPFSRWIRWAFVLTEWMLAPMRRIIPLFGMLDLTPLIAWFLLNLLQSALGIP
jgi:YggT family protein